MSVNIKDLIPSESAEQQRLVQWAKDSIAKQTDPLKALGLRWLYKITNENVGGFYTRKSGKRGPSLSRLRAIDEGVNKGVFDLCLPYPAQGFHGLYIEMKSYDGKESEAQIAFGAYLDLVGYKRGRFIAWQHAARFIVDYMELDQYAAIPAAAWLALVDKIKDAQRTGARRGAGKRTAPHLRRRV